jgi:hypothetical protein
MPVDKKLVQQVRATATKPRNFNQLRDFATDIAAEIDRLKKWPQLYEIA